MVSKIFLVFFIVMTSALGFAKPKVVVRDAQATKTKLGRFILENMTNSFEQKCSKCVFTIRELNLPLNISSLKDENFKMETIDLDLSQFQAKGSFNLPLYIYENGVRQVSWVTGNVSVQSYGYVSNKYLNSSERIQKEDIEQKLVDVTFSRDSVATESEILNQSLNRSIGIGQVIYKSDIKKEMAAKRGQSLKLLIGGDTFEISTNVTAEENGFLGDYIKVKNTDTQKVLSAQVVEPGVVRVK